MPRISLVAFSFNQLSTTMEAPAMMKPVKARKTIQTYWLITRPVSSAMIAPDAAKVPNARTCPTRRTSRGAKRQPATKPPAQAVPSRPSDAVEKPSACPRSGKSSPCRPDAATRKPVREEAKGSDERHGVGDNPTCSETAGVMKIARRSTPKLADVREDLENYSRSGSVGGAAGPAVTEEVGETGSLAGNDACNPLVSSESSPWFFQPTVALFYLI